MTDEAVRRQPGLAELDDTTLAVRTLINASQDLTVRMARRMGVNVSDMTAILWLSEHGPVGGAELARRLGISTAATTVLVDRLERTGYVERVRDTTDRRRVRVTETAAARAAALHAWRPVILDIDEVCRSLPPAQQPLVRDFLARLTTVMSLGGRPQEGDVRPGPDGRRTTTAAEDPDPVEHARNSP